MHPLKAVLSALPLLALTACGGPKSPATNSAVAAATKTPADSAFALAVGTWAWANGDSTCQAMTHTVSFSTDHSVMTITHSAPIDTVTGNRVSTYRVLDAGEKLMTGLPYVIRGALDDESRKTDAGALVVWDLVIIPPNRYHWHRTDWPEGAVTKGIVRCDGTRALDTWSPSGVAAAGGQ